VSHSFVPASDGTQLYLRKRSGPDGSTTTSLLCDGIACDGFIWKYLWDRVAARTFVAHWHYRGHGRSQVPRDPEKLGIADHAEDLRAVRAALGDPEVVLFGHSMGCQVVLESLRAATSSAATNTAKVRGIVLICGAPGRVTHSFKGSDALAQFLPRLIDVVTKNPNVTRAIWGGVPTELALRVAFALGEVDRDRMSPEDLMPYLEHMVDMDPPMFLKMLRNAGDHSAEDLLPNVDVPALVIASDRDTFTPPHLAERMARTMPHGELLMLSGTHAVPLEQRDAVESKIDDFLARITSPT
jgi:pimeloyl-ACP methyl ester carboxylesterase